MACGCWGEAGVVTAGLVVDIFAGPGGWSEGLRTLGLAEIGIEWDDAACRTAMAAGHTRVRADVSRFPLDLLMTVAVLVLICSPPCTTFSAAGKGAGRRVLAELAEAIRDALAGQPRIAYHRRRVARVLKAAARTHPAQSRWSRARRSAWAWDQAANAMLVVEPARFIAACHPENVAMEQVPQVEPLFEVYAHGMRALGYDVKVKKLHAEQYGVPQTRTRVILAASRTGPARLPQPTHTRYRKGEPRVDDGALFGLLPCVSMAEALDWGATERPVPTVTAGGGATGGAEPIARGGRASLESERDRGAWVVDRRTNSRGARGTTVPSAPVPVDRPSPTLTSNTGTQWVLRANSLPNATERALDEPAPTVTGAHDSNERRFVLRNNNTDHAAERDTDEPAPTLFFSARVNAVTWEERPAPTVVGTRRSDAGIVVGRQLPEGEGRNVGGWGYERPSTAVCADSRGAPPGWRGGRAQYERGEDPPNQFDNGVRVTLAEASVLQGFRPDYPWQGSRSKQFEQVGNAVPPPLACAVVGELLGLDWRAALDAESRAGAA